MFSSLSRSLIIAAAALTLVGCGHKRRRPADDGYAASSAGRDMPVGASWNGLWQTSFGRLAMEHQNDGTVIGVYKYINAGREVVGALKGPLDGGTLRFKWAESEGGAGTGHGVFYMNADGASFNGTWGPGESFTGGGAWNGARVQ